MPILMLLLLVGVLAYLWWRWTRTTLTRNCRWRERPGDGTWRCAYCGAEMVSDAPPRLCLASQQ